MNTYTYTEARQKLASLLDKAKKEGKIIITRRDGSTFELRSLSSKKSPLDVEGINLRIKKEEILDVIDEIRSR